MRPGHEWYTHALDLAKQHNVRMVMDTGMHESEARALVAERTVSHAPIVDDKSYICSMHEMGHIVDPKGHRPTEIAAAKTQLEAVKIKVEMEEAAWAWAKANALEWTQEMERIYAFYYATYLQELRAADGSAPPDAMGDMFGFFFGPGVPGAPMPPPVPTRPIDPHAGQRMAAAHKRTAQSIVASILKERKQ